MSTDEDTGVPDDRPAPLDLLLRAVLDGIDDAVVVTSSIDHRVVFANAAGRAAIGGVGNYMGAPPGWQATEMRGDGLAAHVLRPSSGAVRTSDPNGASEAPDRHPTPDRDPTHDPATGLIARPLLVDRLAHAAARSQRAGGSLALLVVHLERLDLLDDGLRDHVASVVAGRLLTSVRDGDTVARLEPAEFVVLLEDVAVDRIAADVGSRIVSSLALPIELPGTQAGTIELGVAIGAAIHDGVTGVGQLMVAADEAASRAREAADGEVVIVGRRPD